MNNADKKQMSLDHYDRMIEWAKKRKPATKADETKMEFAIGENWDGFYCVYCKHTEECRLCPLATVNTSFGYYDCCSGLWKGMSISDTWGQWVYWAEKVRDYIKMNG